MKTTNYLLLSLLVSTSAFSQNVAINSTGAAANPAAALDVNIANKGILIPSLALTSTTVWAPVTGAATGSLMVYNTATAGVVPNNVTPGYYYWNPAVPRWERVLAGANNYWITGASAAGVNNVTATGFLGTTSNNHIDLVTNGVVRGRLSNLGEFFIGTTATALAGDLMNGVSNAAFPWAINGYSSQNGSGVYGAIQAGTTIFGAVQGEYNGTNVSGTGVRGLIQSATAGTSFAAVPTGVYGDATSAGSYKFGVYGTGGTSTRSGGVMGYDYGVALGALGYYANSTIDYSVYGFGIAYFTGAAGGKGEKSNSILPEVNTNIGIGIYGGMMGGWFRGLAYGTHVKGEIYSMYIDGKTYANAPITQLIETENNRQPVYSTSAMKVEISDRGKSNLNSGEVYVPFTQEFKNTISADPNELTITVSPMGNSNGVYISSYDANGFTVKENNSGVSNVAFTWIAIGTRKNYETMDHNAQILDKTFDQKMEGVMYNDNNTTGTPQTMWWDGTQMRFDVPPPAKQADPNYINTARPKAKAVSTSTTTTIEE
ncbi:MAG: hypothetical protein ACK46Y_01480 [Fluviicola sp.]